MSRQLLTAAQQARIAGSVAAYLPTDVLCDIVRIPSPRIPDGMGGFEDDWQLIAGGLPALIEPWVGRGGGDEVVVEERFEQSGRWKISLEAQVDVIAADRVRTTTGREFEVSFVTTPESLQVMTELICVERLNG